MWKTEQATNAMNPFLCRTVGEGGSYIAVRTETCGCLPFTCSGVLAVNYLVVSVSHDLLS